MQKWLQGSNEGIDILVITAEMVQQLRVCPLRFSIALLFAFRTALTVPQYSTETSQRFGRYFEKLRCKKMQFPLFADHSVGFGLVPGGYNEPSTALVQPPPRQGQPWGCPLAEQGRPWGKGGNSVPPLPYFPPPKCWAGFWEVPAVLLPLAGAAV